MTTVYPAGHWTNREFFYRVPVRLDEVLREVLKDISDLQDLPIPEDATTVLVAQICVEQRYNSHIEAALTEWHIGNYDQSACAPILTSSAVEANVMIGRHGAVVVVELMMRANSPNSAVIEW